MFGYQWAKTTQKLDKSFLTLFLFAIMLSLKRHFKKAVLPVLSRFLNYKAIRPCVFICFLMFGNPFPFFKCYALSCPMDCELFLVSVYDIHPLNTWPLITLFTKQQKDDSTTKLRLISWTIKFSICTAVACVNGTHNTYSTTCKMTFTSKQINKSIHQHSSIKWQLSTVLRSLDDQISSRHVTPLFKPLPVELS